jgi:hypothetical protein
MPELSQRTLAKVISALSEMVPQTADTFPLMRDFWRTKLFEWGFPGWFIDYVISRSMNWSLVIPELFSGNIKGKDGLLVESFLCHQMLLTLTAQAYDESKGRSAKENIRLSLQLDGYDIGDGKMISIDGPVSVEEEKSRLLRNLKASRLGRQDVISKHITDAEDLFSDGKYHPAIGEARSAFQAVIEETAKLLETKSGNRSGGGTKNQVDFMTQQSFLSADEQVAFLSAWGFLCSGNHPGLSSEEEGRVGIILCLEFIQILLAKGKALL